MYILYIIAKYIIITANYITSFLIPVTVLSYHEFFVQ